MSPFPLARISFYFIIDAVLVLNNNVIQLILVKKLLKAVLEARHMLISQCAEKKNQLKKLGKMKTKIFEELANSKSFSICGICRTHDLEFACALPSFSNL